MQNSLFQISQLRLNLLPFVHQVSTLDLVRNKFTLCQDRTKMPMPNELEIRALIHLLRINNLKTGSICAHALKIFVRYPELQRYIINHADEITENIVFMVEQLVDVGTQLSKCQKNASLQARMQALIIYAREAMVEGLQLLCQLPYSKKNNVILAHLLQLWSDQCSSHDFAVSTAKYVKFLTEKAGKDIFKYIEGNKALETISGF